MIQYYVRNPYEPMFTGENHPRLRYFGEINADEDKSPRVMHAHDDFVEVLLLREGTCTYLIRSRLYKVSAGDLIVYNSGVLHDESVWAENGVSTYCLAIDGLSHRPDFALIDGNRDRGRSAAITAAHRCLVKGDSLSASIAAASILAKVSRDRHMVEQAQKYPEYHFEKHKGYGTKLHYELLAQYGPCPIHRRTFLKER